MNENDRNTMQSIIKSQAEAIAALLAAPKAGDSSVTNQVLREMIVDRDQVIESLWRELAEERRKNK